MMEDNRRDPSSEFDSEYIDQLFSARRTPAEPASPAPIPEAPNPEPESAPEPPKPRRNTAPLLLAAVGLLLLGFLIGALATREKQPENVTTPPATTLAPHFGFIPSYETWSTDSLAVAATELPILWDIPVTQENFEALAEYYPVLEILADRNDALDALQKISETGNASDAVQWLTQYINNFIPQLPHCKWLQLEDSHFKIFEFTVAPNMSVMTSPTANGTTKTVLEFYGHLFVVEGEPEILKEECNFWFLLEKKEGSNAKLDTEFFQIYNETSIPDARIDFLPC